MLTDARPVCAVTGTSGYVGGAIADFLEAREFPVRRLSRSSGYSLEDSAPAFPGDGVDVLIHCAYDFSPSSWEAVHRVNVEGSLRLFETAARHGVRRVVFISSLAAYDGCASLYGRGKRLVEHAALAMGGHAIRPGTIFGPRPRGLMGSLSAQVMTRKFIPVVRHQEALRLAHQDDLAALTAALAMGELPGTPSVWLAAGQRNWNLGQLVAEMARRAGRDVRMVPLPWQVVWGGVKTLEIAGLKPAFRSDSVLSLAHPIPPEQLADLSVAPNCPFRDY